MPDDFEAQHDLETLVRAKEINKDQARMDRAKRFAENKREEIDDIVKDFPSKPAPRFNGAVKNSKMGS